MADPEDFPLIADPEGVLDIDDDLASAEQSLLDEPEVDEELTVPMPHGRTPKFDWERGRFVRSGSSPVWVEGPEALIQLVMMILHTSQGVLAVFDDQIGLEETEEIIGNTATVRDAMADWAQAATDAIMVLDRVVAVEDIELELDQARQAVIVRNMTIVTDDENDELRIGPTAVTIGG